MKAWQAALAAAIASAAIALLVIAPMAQSGKSRPGLKVVSVTESNFSGRAVAKCPRKYVVVGGGAAGGSSEVLTNFGKDSPRRWEVRTVGTGADKRGGPFAGAQAICAKGTGGFHIEDAGEFGLE